MNSKPTSDASPLHRSGAVARMLGMPVATLRVWERRYALTSGAQSPGGQRLYSEDDVRRLALLKQLSDRGHAIGMLATLDRAQLQQVAATHAQAQATARALPQRAPAPVWRLVVVGQALGPRLRRPELLRHLGRPLEVLGPFDTVAQAAAALHDAGSDAPVDAWLVQAPQLQPGWLDAQEAAAPAFAGARKAVLYGFAPDVVCEALASRGVALLREPQPDAALAQWLRLLALASASPSSAGVDEPGDAPAPSRRWNEPALSSFAARATSVACECPRHVAELLIQLSRFEAYSAQCEGRSPADAALHAHLGQVVAGARVRFEAALERLALHEGLPLP